MNKNGMFRGFSAVFSFTAKNVRKGKGFKGVTIIIALIFFGIFAGINIVGALMSKDKEEEKVEITLNCVQVVDETGMLQDLAALEQFFEGQQEKKLSFVKSEESVNATVNKLQKEKNQAVLHSYMKSKGKVLCLEMKLAEDSDATKGEADKILGTVKNYLEQVKLQKAELTQVQLEALLLPVNVTYSQAGKSEESMGVFLLRMIAPMIFALLMYMLVLLYGQSISKGLVAEKTSKLMETLLISVTPYAVVMGKVLGIAFMAIVQMLLWTVAGVLGYHCGNYVSELINPKYENILREIFGIIQKDAKNAFRPDTVILFAIISILGFLLFSFLVAVCSAKAKQISDLQGPMSLYNLVVVLCFLVSYGTSMGGISEAYQKILNYVPFTAAFRLPVDILLGEINMANMGISIGIMIIAAFVLVIFTGKIYKKNVF